MLKKFHTLYYYLILSIINHFLSGPYFFKIKQKLLNSIGIRVGIDTKIVGPLKIGKSVNIHFQDGCWIGANFSVYGNGIVKVGNSCDIAPDVTILTGSHEVGISKRRAGIGVTWNYNIGDGSWIGAKTTITNGANIGAGVVIGACSLITRPCIDNSLYLGIPAKLVKELSV